MSQFINEQSLETVRKHSASDSTIQIAEIGKSVGEIIEFLNQMKLYVENTETELMNRVQDLTVRQNTAFESLLNQAQSTQRLAVNRVLALVIVNMVATVAVAVYLITR